jgi:uncharacterized protein YggE
MTVMQKFAAAAAISFAFAALAAHAAQAESLPTAGTLVVVPAFGEVRHVNDQAMITMTAEEQDKDRAAAQARVNQKMKQGTEIVRRARIRRPS